MIFFYYQCFFSTILLFLCLSIAFTLINLRYIPSPYCCLTYNIINLISIIICNYFIERTGSENYYYLAVKSHFQSSACYDLLLRKIQQSLLHPLQQLRMVHRTYTLYILHIIYIRFPLVKYQDSWHFLLMYILDFVIE